MQTHSQQQRARPPSGDESERELLGGEGKDSGAATRIRGQHKSPTGKTGQALPRRWARAGKAGFLHTSFGQHRACPLTGRGEHGSLQPAVTRHLPPQHQLNCTSSWVRGGQMSDQQLQCKESSEVQLGGCDLSPRTPAMYLRKKQKKGQKRSGFTKVTTSIISFIHSFILSSTNIYGTLPKMCQASSKPLGNSNEIKNISKKRQTDYKFFFF